jgi:hypothetical protein
LHHQKIENGAKKVQWLARSVSIGVHPLLTSRVRLSCRKTSPFLHHFCTKNRGVGYRRSENQRLARHGAIFGAIPGRALNLNAAVFRIRSNLRPVKSGRPSRITPVGRLQINHLQSAIRIIGRILMFNLTLALHLVEIEDGRNKSAG